MIFETTISLGNIITAIVTIIAAAGFIWSLRGDMMVSREVTREQIKNIGLMLEQFSIRFHTSDERESVRFERLEAEVRDIAKKMSVMIRQDERINNLEQRIDDLWNHRDRSQTRRRKKQGPDL